VERANHEQAKLDLARDEVARLESRERVNRALGLSGATTGWRAAEELQPLPASDPTLTDLESVAVRQRLDVAMARRRVDLFAKAVSLARSTRLFGRLEVGVDMHRDPSGPRVLGPNLVIELPIFDQRQAAIARLEAQRREQERQLTGTTLDARREVRLAQAHLMAARATALHYRDTLLPLRAAILEQSQLHYNGMFIGLYQLLAAKQAEIEARKGALEALRDYWTARAELARAIGGALPLEKKKGDRK
jgi:cobalt-zinc-cadmium efflux system outer membrane protein